MNTFKIIFSYDYASKLISIGWKDLIFAIDHGFMAQESLIEYAIHLVNTELEPAQIVIDIACLNKGDSIYPYLDKLKIETGNKNGKEPCNKFLYLLLNWVYTHKESYSDPFDVVEVIYGDFDYPEEIAGFVRYMPTAEPVYQSLQLNRERMYRNWEQYLKEQRAKYSLAGNLRGES
ncbi:DUF2247 family protein [Paenibacillus lutrae]|uniref:DUF2247 family protein n=1 Tax=Paenibacillus lutrae TaxID=2078573 RepID=A0A7X3FMY7_9BACL|nr:DUF2247 family protein [Paenibacillus lutrae]MVP02568.1 DUF2247 family protein [Paenibacillus lutrae]